jgi:hypothetical protein
VPTRHVPSKQGWAKTRPWRIAGRLNRVSGEPPAQQAAHFDCHTLLADLRGLETVYPAARHLFLVLDH